MNRYPVSFAHGAITLNRHLNADGSPNATYLQNTITLDNRRIERTYREGRDPYHLATGGALGRVHKGMTLIRFDGRILAPDASQEATASDQERAFLAAFDPDLCASDSPSTDGAYAFDFTEPTADTGTYPTGRISLRYYARPMSAPSIDERLGDGGVRRYAAGLIAPDPRCYEQAEQSLVLTPGSASGAVLNRGTVPAPLKATIVMAGAGASNFTITRGGVSFVLNLSTATAGQTVVVVMETCGPYGRGRLITKAGVESFSLKTSAATTWLTVPVGSTTFSITNTTNVTSCTLAWYSARA